jgi:hypothetical protein
LIPVGDYTYWPGREYGDSKIELAISQSVRRPVSYLNVRLSRRLRVFHPAKEKSAFRQCRRMARVLSFPLVGSGTSSIDGHLTLLLRTGWSISFAT